MRRFSILAISGIVMLLLAAFLGSATSEQKTLKDQLVGAWALVSIDYVRADGSRSSTFGENPKGIAFFDGSGNYIITVMRADRSKYAINDRAQGTAEETKQRRKELSLISEHTPSAKRIAAFRYTW